MLKRFYKALFFTTRFYLAAGVIVLLFVLAFFVPPLLAVAEFCTLALTLLVITDLLLLFAIKAPVTALRKMSARFSNGDDNSVMLTVSNPLRYPLWISVLEELPFQFQRRDFVMTARLPPQQSHIFSYTLRPVERGEYRFGNSNLLVTTFFGLVQRLFAGKTEQPVKVYPSYLQLRQYELMAFQNKMQDLGVHRRRMIGHSMEFDHIKEYTQGDDVRTLNWKATARRGVLMVNNYVEEKSQQVICVIDKSRNMKMPFDGMTLLDYAVNATLVFSNVALQKGDKTGLVTFVEQHIEFLPPANKKIQLNKILEMLYAQETQWQESDFERLSVHLRTSLSQRSLLVLFTNFESLSSMQRQLPYLRKLAKYHLVMVIFFENTGLRALTTGSAVTTEDIYIQTIAQKFIDEKRLIAKELLRYGIVSVLSTPEQLTIDVVNKYLELKASMQL
ncbi:DUF58 domain-containing protein [Chitinophaga costaii]|nr:DUF58 domain-containing protein [Chitinophaga costaii]PUZ19988.1 DUF58 domain-containing protein [Chitinophaga costaii]